MTRSSKCIFWYCLMSAAADKDYWTEGSQIKNGLCVLMWYSRCSYQMGASSSERTDKARRPDLWPEDISGNREQCRTRRQGQIRVRHMNLGSDLAVDEKLRNVHASRIEGQRRRTKHKTPSSSL